MKNTQPQKICTKTRAEIARFMETQMTPKIKRTTKHTGHYGKCDLRNLMDFLFDGPPLTEEEAVFSFREK